MDNINIYPNMSYCAIQNTAAALRQVVALLEEDCRPEEYLSETSTSERQAWSRLVSYAERILELEDEMKMNHYLDDGDLSEN